MAIPLFALYEFKSRNAEIEPIPGFFVVSTAQENVEDEEQSNLLEAASMHEKQNLLDGLEFLGDPTRAIQHIADILYLKTKEGEEDAELVIVIHGYNTGLSSVKNWYQNIWQYANKNISSQNTVFLGYRWSSEQFVTEKILSALKSLPVLLASLFYGGILGILLSLFMASQISLITFTLCFGISGFLATLILALILLRIFVYFRDSYRASNFGVSDLVELLRQLNKALFEKGLKEHKINLSFIAHSMGGFVTTNMVRTLSDVFDPASVGELNSSNKAPNKELGDVFCLNRLVLVAPDISTNTIISGRANFLKSSLRRFEEAYLFSNEGDLALRIASTAANYFSFPTNERKQGHRLGNVTVKPFDKQKELLCGVINQSVLKNDVPQPLIDYLEINTLRESIPIKKLQKSSSDRDGIANFFTYFDCTNYRDRKIVDLQQDKFTKKETQILSYRLHGFPRYLSILNTFVYARLILDWGVRKKIDVHGGYFEGEFLRSTIYKLAFMGLQGLLTCFKPEEKYVPNSTPSQYEPLFQDYSKICEQKQIQVVFSPKLYKSKVLGQVELLNK